VSGRRPPSGRAAWIAKGRALGVLEAMPKTVDGDNLIASRLGSADALCAEYPKGDQARVWSWFTEGRMAGR